ncbi:MAG: tyrosinase family protein [Marmoricola sp.]
MARTRVDVWNATDAEGDWPLVLQAYERAVATMRGLDPPSGPPTDPVSWQFQAAIHGRADENGDADTSDPFWCACQHGSWFFLPWHRMYLAAFERIIQFHLEDDQWALPYWYAIDPDSPKKAAVPPAFLDLTLGDNNLQTEERSQTAKAGLPFYGDIDPVQVGETVLQTLVAASYSTPTGQATFGGGERADLSFDGGERGLLENVPHGAVHSLVGNDYDEFGQLLDPGWMGSFFTAGLDPLFWLHHANIDRLWEVWLRADASHVNPTGDPAFLDTTFTFPAPEGGEFTWSVGEVLDTDFLDYVYESLEVPSVLAPPPGPEDERDRALTPQEESMPPQMLGATSDVSLASSDPVAVQMERPSRDRELDSGPAPRAYLRVEGVTGSSAAPLYGVYVNVPEGADPREFPELRAGSFSTFGLAETSQTDDLHAGEGLTAVFDITALRDRLAEDGRWDDARVDVSFSTEVPGRPAQADPPRSEVEPLEPDLRARRVAIMVD